MFEKEKALNRVRREQELALAKLHAAHRKQLLDAKTEALGMACSRAWAMPKLTQLN